MNSENKNETAKTAYEIEQKKSENSEIHRKLNGEQIKEKIENAEIQTRKMLQAYNRNGIKKKKDKTKEEKVEKVDKKQDKEQKNSEEVKTEKQKVEEFKKKLKPEKSELDKACEEFKDVLEKRDAKEFLRRKHEYRLRHMENMSRD